MSMDIAVFGSEDSSRGRQFVAAFRASGGTPWTIAPDSKRIPDSSRLRGALVFDSPSVRTPSASSSILRLLAFRGIPWFRVGVAAPSRTKGVDPDGGSLSETETDAALIHAVANYPQSRPLESASDLDLASVLATATTHALTETACTEPEVACTFRQSLHRWLGHVSAEIRTQGSPIGAIAFGATESGAMELTRRVLGNANRSIDAAIVEDCIAELANIIAGQAKALLAGTNFRFTFAKPEVRSAESNRSEFATQQILVVSLMTDLGPLATQVRTSTINDDA
jgi:chemotaxis protein CheX